MHHSNDTIDDNNKNKRRNNFSIVRTTLAGNHSDIQLCYHHIDPQTLTNVSPDVFASNNTW